MQYVTCSHLTSKGNSSLQIYLNHLMSWCNTWLLFFGLDKCMYMRIGSSPVIRSYYLTKGADVCLIGEVTEERDLGLVFTSD